MVWKCSLTVSLWGAAWETVNIATGLGDAHNRIALAKVIMKKYL
uniref:Uncharacterized protein n=1 Tax=Anguilla anguilla TaxID=7936 RepID=A0A0E9VEZ4_ANGAN